MAPARRTPARKRTLLLTAAGLCVVLAAVVVTLLLTGRPDDEERRPASLTIPEGWRATQVYAAADKALDVRAGTTKKAARKAAHKGTLNLPPQANGTPEGYLYPATYPITEDTTPASLLSFMANTAAERLGQHDADYDTLTVASLAQAEADTPGDMSKVARVITNRLAQDKPLELDSTINYALGRSTLKTTHADTRLDSPYNTYRHKGLPPTPVNNPGEDAIRAAADPPKGDWLYFVTVKPGDTRFATTYRQHEKHVAEFNRNQSG